MASADQAAFEGCFRTACGQAIFEGWGRDDVATQAALDLLDFGNELLQSAGPRRLPPALDDTSTASITASEQLPVQQPTAFWQGPAGQGMSRYLTLAPCQDADRVRRAARVKASAKTEPPGKGGIKRKKSSDAAGQGSGTGKKQRAAGKKTLAKGLPRAMQAHFATLLSCMDASSPPEGPDSYQVTFCRPIVSTRTCTLCQAHKGSCYPSW